MSPARCRRWRSDLAGAFGEPVRRKLRLRCTSSVRFGRAVDHRVRSRDRTRWSWCVGATRRSRTSRSTESCEVGTKTSASASNAQVPRARSIERSNATLRLPRLSQAKYADSPRIALSYARAGSPPLGRSILTTSAPMSANCREQNGAATACSSATTRKPLRGSWSVAFTVGRVPNG